MVLLFLFWLVVNFAICAIGIIIAKNPPTSLPRPYAWVIFYTSFILIYISFIGYSCYEILRRGMPIDSINTLENLLEQNLFISIGFILMNISLTLGFMLQLVLSLKKKCKTFAISPDGLSYEIQSYNGKSLEENHANQLRDQESFFQIMKLLTPDSIYSVRVGAIYLLSDLARKNPVFAQRCLDLLCSFNEWMPERARSHPDYFGNKTTSHNKWRKRNWSFNGEELEKYWKMYLNGQGECGALERKEAKEAIDQEKISQIVIGEIEKIIKHYLVFHSQFIQLDLSAKHLNEINLGGVQIQSNIKFNDASLIGANFSKAQLQEVNFTNALLNKASFMSAEIALCDFSKAQMRDADLVKSKIRETDFSRTLMWNVLLMHSEVVLCKFYKTSLDLANFYHSQIRICSFFRASLVGINCFNADIANSDFSRTNLHLSVFYNAKLQAVSFIHACLLGVNFVKCRATFMIANYAKLISCNFEQADIQGLISYKTNLTNSYFDTSPSCPYLSHSILGKPQAIIIPRGDELGHSLTEEMENLLLARVSDAQATKEHQEAFNQPESDEQGWFNLLQETLKQQPLSLLAHYFMAESNDKNYEQPFSLEDIERALKIFKDYENNNYPKTNSKNVEENVLSLRSPNWLKKQTKDT